MPVEMAGPITNGQVVAEEEPEGPEIMLLQPLAEWVGRASAAALRVARSITQVEAGAATITLAPWFQVELGAGAAVLEMEIPGHQKTGRRIKAEAGAESATPQDLAVQGEVELLFWLINNTTAMKKKSILYSVVAVSLIGFGFSNKVKGQGSLQFNQVVLVSSQNQDICNTCWTVPANKVWKITGFSTNSNNIGSISINGLEGGYLLGRSFSNSSSSYATGRWHEPVFPIWLPAGSTLGFQNIGNNRNIHFYGIEFNIIP